MVGVFACEEVLGGLIIPDRLQARSLARVTVMAMKGLMSYQRARRRRKMS